MSRLIKINLCYIERGRGRGRASDAVYTVRYVVYDCEERINVGLDDATINYLAGLAGCQGN